MGFVYIFAFFKFIWSMLLIQLLFHSREGGCYASRAGASEWTISVLWLLAGSCSHSFAWRDGLSGLGFVQA